MKTYDYITRVVLALPLTVNEGMWTYSPLSFLCSTMNLRVCRKFFEITTFPNKDSPRARHREGRPSPSSTPLYTGAGGTP